MTSYVDVAQFFEESRVGQFNTVWQSEMGKMQAYTDKMEKQFSDRILWTKKVLVDGLTKLNKVAAAHRRRVMKVDEQRMNHEDACEMEVANLFSNLTENLANLMGRMTDESRRRLRDGSRQPFQQSYRKSREFN